MKVILDSPVNKYYVQTLGMIFFPGEHFSEKETDDANGAPVLSVKSNDSDEGVSAWAEISYNGKREAHACFVEYSPERTKERTLKLAVGRAVLYAIGSFMGYRPAWGTRPYRAGRERCRSNTDPRRASC